MTMKIKKFTSALQMKTQQATQKVQVTFDIKENLSL